VNHPHGETKNPCKPAIHGGGDGRPEPAAS
jgi:hypothetical protein